MTKNADYVAVDSIVAKVANHSKTDSFADVANDLYKDHAHHIGATWKSDLAKTSEAFHQKGLLPGLDIVGVHGSEFVTKNRASGKIEKYDATDLTTHHDAVEGNLPKNIGGREASVSADGSGQITVQQGDNATKISADVLRSQGIENPTRNQIANYEKEMEHANGRKLGRLHQGEQLTLPANSGPKDTGEFAGDRITKEKAGIAEQVTDAKDALSKNNYWFQNMYGRGITKSEIEKNLNDSSNTDAQKKGLKFMYDNFDKISSGGSITPSNLDAYMNKRNAEIDQAARF